VSFETWYLFSLKILQSMDLRVAPLGLAGLLLCLMQTVSSYMHWQPHSQSSFQNCMLCFSLLFCFHIPCVRWNDCRSSKFPCLQVKLTNVRIYSVQHTCKVKLLLCPDPTHKRRVWARDYTSRSGDSMWHATTTCRHRRRSSNLTLINRKIVIDSFTRILTHTTLAFVTATCDMQGIYHNV